MYILIIINMVYGGAVTTTQEFTDRQACEAAILVIKEKTNSEFWTRRPIGLQCVPKSKDGL